MIELLKLGLPIVVDSDGQTALHLAASAGHLEMVEALIQAGCDVGIQDFVSEQITILVKTGFWEAHLHRVNIASTSYSAVAWHRLSACFVATENEHKRVQKN